MQELKSETRSFKMLQGKPLQSARIFLGYRNDLGKLPKVLTHLNSGNVPILLVFADVPRLLAPVLHSVPHHIDIS